MKIILSRKGFDSSNGGCASPIMPDGTLLSMPIPSNDAACYDDLQYQNTKYSDLLKQLNPYGNYKNCHIDPDIRSGNRTNPIAHWEPAFGQINAAQGVLSNAGVEEGDIFLFFGWFHQTAVENGTYYFIHESQDDFYRCADLHIIYGYMQIGQILKGPEDIRRFSWHPHSAYHKKSNALYLPSEYLSLNPALPGYGTLDFREDRVLTKSGCSRANWRKLDFLMPEHVYGNKKNSSRSDGLYYAGIWQELVIFESDGLLDWVRTILQ